MIDPTGTREEFVDLIGKLRAEIVRLQTVCEQLERAIVLREKELTRLAAEVRELRADGLRNFNTLQVIRNLLDIGDSVSVEDAVNRLLAERNRLRDEIAFPSKTEK